MLTELGTENIFWQLPVCYSLHSMWPSSLILLFLLTTALGNLKQGYKSKYFRLSELKMEHFCISRWPFLNDKLEGSTGVCACVCVYVPLPPGVWEWHWCWGSWLQAPACWARTGSWRRPSLQSPLGLAPHWTFDQFPFKTHRHRFSRQT